MYISQFEYSTVRDGFPNTREDYEGKEMLQLF
jgi:hypothetical protein